MSISADAVSPAEPVQTEAAGDVAWLRRGSLAVLVLVVAEYGIGMYVNLYVTIPPGGGGLASAFGNGPAMLGIHAWLGVLLGMAAVGVLVQAVVARRAGAITASATGLLALVAAATNGANFTSSGRAAESMAMSLLAGVGLLCYAANLYLAGRPSQHG